MSAELNRACLIRTQFKIQNLPQRLNLKRKKIAMGRFSDLDSDFVQKVKFWTQKRIWAFINLTGFEVVNHDFNRIETEPDSRLVSIGLFRPLLETFLMAWVD